MTNGEILMIQENMRATKKVHKNAVDKTGKLKPKYKDVARFPKVQTDGYEKAFNDSYQGVIDLTISEIKKELL